MKLLLTVLLAIFFYFPLPLHAFEYEYAKPSYDSGWHTINQGQKIKFNHNIGGSVGDYVVDMQYRNDQLANLQHKRLHNRFYGSQLKNGTIGGISWHGLNTTSITTHRGVSDDDCQEVRVRIWKITGADYDSGWKPYQKGDVKVLAHNLGGKIDEYVVYMEFKSLNSILALGIHQTYYGGATDTSGPQNEHYGAQWARLTSKNITVARMANDAFADHIRIRIYRMKYPDYDSGWQTINQGQELILNHGVNNPFSDFTVYLEFKDPDNNAGINHVYFGGLETGSSWQGAAIKNLTGSSITLYRNTNDPIADEMRVRIWKCSAPKYESAWVPVQQNSLVTLTHGLPGSVTDDYVVTLEGRTTAGTIHNQFIGGTDVADIPPNTPSPFISQGMYWFGFNNQDISVKREANDADAKKVRVRIWIPPKADIDSGWIDPRDALKNPVTFNSLGGDPDDYFVYVEGKDENFGGKARNQYHLGGDSYFVANSGFNESGFSYSNLTTTSVTLNVGAFTLSEKVRIRIWKKKNGRLTIASLNQPAEGTHNFVYSNLSVTNTVFNLQFTYNIAFGISNKLIGGVWSIPTEPTGFHGAYWMRSDTQKQGMIITDDGFSKINLYAWDVSWKAKQAMPKNFFWPMFQPAINSGKK